MALDTFINQNVGNKAYNMSKAVDFDFNEETPDYILEKRNKFFLQSMSYKESYEHRAEA